MKEYIFLTPSIRNMGGSQIFVSHKVQWLESQGWKVNVFYTNLNGDIRLENLKRYEKNYLPALSIPFAVVDEKIRQRTAKRVLPTSADKVIIECHITGFCLWGEYLGNLCGGMTICYPLTEDLGKPKKEELDFFYHKLKQNLLFGISDASIPTILGKSALTEHRGLLAVGTGSNLSDEDYKLPLRDNAKTILAFGRMEKPYVPNMVSSVKRFLDRHKDSCFNIIFLGDAPNQKLRDSIVSSFSECSNSNVFCTGYLDPVPRSIFQKCDVAIASAGCVSVASKQGVLTISVDSNDHKALGVFGVTTNESLFRKDDPPQEIDDLLEDILIDNKYSKTDIKLPVRVSDYSKHEEIINRYAPNAPYEMHFPPLRFRDKLKRALISVVGCDIYVKYFAVIPFYMKLKKLL